MARKGARVNVFIWGEGGTLEGKSNLEDLGLREQGQVRTVVNTVMNRRVA